VPVRRRVAIATAVSALAGPAAAVLYEAGHLRVFPGNPLGDVGFVAAVAIVSFFRGAEVAAIVGVVANACPLPKFRPAVKW